MGNKRVSYLGEQAVKDIEVLTGNGGHRRWLAHKGGRGAPRSLRHGSPYLAFSPLAHLAGPI